MLNFMALYSLQGWKNDTIKSGKPICNPWGQTKSQNMLKVGSKFFQPWFLVSNGAFGPTNCDKMIPKECLLIGWMLLAGMFWVQKVQKFQIYLILDNTIDILPITGTELKQIHPKRRG